MKISPLRVRSTSAAHEFDTVGRSARAPRADGFERKGKKPQVDLEDPAVDPSDKKLKDIVKVRFTGPMIRRGISVRDVVQGGLGDCFCPSAVGGMALFTPKKLERMMKDNEDGTYTFTFKKWHRASQSFIAKAITVDGDLWARNENDPLYADGNLPTSKRKMEMWFPLFEKAYAVFCGKDPKKPGYGSIGSGGYPEDVFEAVLGRKGYSRNIPSYNETWLWKQITTAMDEKRPMSFGTYAPADKRYSGTGIHADHSYSVLGYGFNDKGEQVVKLRNPWGASEPEGDGKDDGIFELPLKKVFKYFQTLGSVV